MISLSTTSTLPPEKAAKKECKTLLKDLRKKLFKLQNMFYADSRFALLIVLQGTDTAGKDGTIRHAMSSMNPMGVNVKSFKKPTEEELKHDFLWRIYPHIPPKGIIEVFNRSYYEDIIVPAVNGTITSDRLKHRFNMINELENHLLQNNIHVLKFFLHISQDEQNSRIKERLEKPHKRWKYDRQDHKTDKEFKAYQEVYDTIFAASNNPPWHIIPSNKRWFRNYSVAKILTEYLEGLDLRYP